MGVVILYLYYSKEMNKHVNQFLYYEVKYLRHPTKHAVICLGNK